jgi:hypothetical protein
MFDIFILNWVRKHHELFHADLHKTSFYKCVLIYDKRVVLLTEMRSDIKEDGKHTEL